MNDDELRDAIVDAVAEVEPTDRLGAILVRTRRRGRIGWYAGAASVLAVAAAVTLVVALGRPGSPGTTTLGDPADRTDRADQAATELTTPPDPSPSSTTPAAPGSTVPTSTVPVYYVGAGPDGPDAPSDVLYRYFAPGTTGAALDLLTTTPQDPDYRTLWPVGSFSGMSDPEADLVHVRLADASLHDRPAAMSEREAELAVQQVVYTLRAAFQEPNLAVQFTYLDNPIDQVYGVPTSEALTNQPELEVLSQMSISDPVEGASYAGSFTARGVSNGFEASVYCRLVAADGTLVWDAPTTAAGWLEARLFPWRLEVDLTDVRPGDYTFTCSTDDPSGGAEGYGAATDTRSITVE